MVHEATTLVGALEAAARRPGGFRFVDASERETSLTHGELSDRAHAVACGLGAAGVVPGEVVALVLPTGPGFLEAFFGALVLGAVPAPVYPPVRLARLDEYQERTAAMLDACGAVALVTDERLARLSAGHVTLPVPRLGVRTVEVLRERGAAGPAAGPTGGPAGAPPPASPDAPALVQFSSGTTGPPRPIVLTHRQLLANIDAIFGALLPGLPDPVAGVSWLPLYHDMGLIGFVLGAVRIAPRREGWLTLIPPELFVARPALWLRAIARHRASISASPDFGYGRAAAKVRDADLDGADLSPWVVALDGAEAIAAATLRSFAARFAPHGFAPQALTPVYGLAEAALGVTFSDPAAPFRSTRFDRDLLSAGEARPGAGAELVSVGRPLEGYSVSIRDARYEPVPPGTIGAILVRGPSVVHGTLRTRAAPIGDGWLDTGDLGVIHEGELYVTGRTKDVIVLRGRNHSPDDIERACSEVAGVRPGCVVAVSDLGPGGERLVVLAERRGEVDHDALAEACARAVRGATGLAPDEVRVLAPGALPRTSSGKLRRHEALRLLRAGAL